MITSPRNPKVAAALRLKKRTFRERERRFLVEGAQAVGEALDHPAGLLALFHTDPGHPLVARAAGSGADAVHVDGPVMGKLTSTVTPQGLLGLSPFVDLDLPAIPGTAGCMVLLHEVRDPGNAGTVLRSADAAGAGVVVFTTSSVDVYNPKTVRASAGSLFHLPVVRDVSTRAAVEEARRRGMRVLALDARGDQDVFGMDLEEPVVFVLGNEARGLPPEVTSLADTTVRVPILGRAESLNLAGAATVCLFEWAKRRRGGPRVVLETIIASAAHDIRSPLTAMKGFGHALSTRWDQMTPEQRELMLTGIVFDTDRLNAIVRQLVDAARLASGSLDLFPERVNVGRVVEQVAESLGRDPEHPPIRWEGGTVEILVDPDRLRLVLEAFIESLVWWTNEGPVRVAAHRSDGRLILDASRRGTDLTQEQAEHLFRPRTPGSGGPSKIGLFVALGVAEAQGGSVSVHVDGALTFRLDIPVDGSEA